MSDQLPIELNVIGVGDPSPNSLWYNRVDVPLGKARYPQFVAWLQNIKHEFDLAVVALVDIAFNRSNSDLDNDVEVWCAAITRFGRGRRAEKRAQTPSLRPRDGCRPPV